MWRFFPFSFTYPANHPGDCSGIYCSSPLLITVYTSLVFRTVVDYFKVVTGVYPIVFILRCTFVCVCVRIHLKMSVHLHIYDDMSKFNQVHVFLSGWENQLCFISNSISPPQAGYRFQEWFSGSTCIFDNAYTVPGVTFSKYLLTC